MKKKILEEQILLLMEKEIAKITNPVRKRVFKLYQSGHTQDKATEPCFQNFCFS